MNASELKRTLVRIFKIKKYFQEDEMPNRLGLLHVRPCGEKQATEDEDVDKVVIDDGLNQ